MMGLKAKETNQLVKSVFFSVLIGVSYFLLLYSIEHTLFSTIPIDFFSTNSDIEMIHVLEYLILLSVVVFLYSFLKKRRLLNPLLIEKGIGIYFLLFFLALCVQILNDPIFRFEEILDNQKLLETSPSTDLSIPLMMLLFCKTVVLGPVTEELVFRGSILGLFSKENKYHLIVGVLLSGLLFSMIHISPTAKIAGLHVGLIAGVIYFRYGLIGAVIFHSAYNLIWLCNKFNQEIYWEFIRTMNFDVYYWLIFSAALAIILYFMINSNSFFANKKIHS